MSLTVVTPPAAEPVSASELKTHLRISTSDDDTYISTFIIPAARHATEKFTGRKLITQTWDWRLDTFPCEFAVPYSPLQSVSSISYVDTDGASQTLNSSVYTVDAYSRPGRIVEAYGQAWPSTRDVPNAVTVRFVCGYGAAGTSVPEDIRQALMMIAGHFYENREATADVTLAEVPKAFEYLLWTHRIFT